eukprot:CAMPEP_0205898976 /NCGR_PEP_ID=MMETSP1083-20121108/26354_1 /ASSEMBLY_ACC=CAM_ASM_000430 /TAXON_ID=97485 /ORGANISM="Prymnesium parvum, Strain Texoma1" /LENGTH=107 /DNA_ID=CAMNT_0053264311 /DNA_START=626 /DNA_END=945 /DNA_ORIENTATION=+
MLWHVPRHVTVSAPRQVAAAPEGATVACIAQPVPVCPSAASAIGTAQLRVARAAAAGRQIRFQVRELRPQHSAHAPLPRVLCVDVKKHVGVQLVDDVRLEQMVKPHP